MGKNLGSEDDKQPGCMWGFVHNWHSNVRKTIHYHRYQGQTHDGNWSRETNIYEKKTLLCEDQRTKRRRATKKRSLRARVKALIAHDQKMKPNLQRTYSIHHLESVDDLGLHLHGKINTNWKKNPIILLPKDSSKANEPADVFEVFKVDMQDSDKSVASAFGLNAKSKFSKSRSFPGPGRKLKPVKLESKQNEVWSNKLRKEEANDGEDGARKSRHLRSWSLNESLDKYTKLKLNSSRSLKLKSEYGIAPLYFTRMHSLSYVDSYYSDLNLEGLVENPSEKGSVVSAKHCSSEEENAKMQCGIHDQSFVFEENDAVEPQIYKGLEHGCGVHELSSSTATYDLQDVKLLENDEIKMRISNSENDMYPKNKSDLDYVRYLLEQSGIAVDASEIAWHSSNELFSPQLFEEVEARWPHTRGELTGCPDFYGCWHHQMLFDLVNEVLLDVYDLSMPYYPKPFSSSCNVRPFPLGHHIIEEVCRGIRRLVDVKADENESLDCIVARDLDHDPRWMNLQLESEFIGLDIEDMIFDELLQEVVFS